MADQMRTVGACVECCVACVEPEGRRAQVRGDLRVVCVVGRRTGRTGQLRYGFHVCETESLVCDARFLPCSLHVAHRHERGARRGSCGSPPKFPLRVPPSSIYFGLVDLSRIPSGAFFSGR